MAKISLCLIVGNVQEYIERCLESFKPIADEVCLVRAIGSQKADETLVIAAAWAQRMGIPLKVGEYHNKAGHSDWPHVDDFAAARQMSFDLADGEYCFWVDSDDILKQGAERIRLHADTGGYAAFIFPYDIFGKNVVVPRERMILKGSGYWKCAVHEAFKFHMDEPTVAMDDAVIVQHLPHLDKTGSNDRNLRILESIPKEEMTPGLQYHLFAELMGAGRDEEAVQLGCKLITGCADLGKDEKYDLLISLVLKTTNLDERVALLHEAHKTDPARREALGVLACTMMDKGKHEWALAYARQMMATEAPDIHAWNSRQPFYGYVGADIFQQALRVNDRHDDAENVRRTVLERVGGPRIALLHATRGRPQQAAKCRKIWHDLAEKPHQIEHIFAFDDDDQASYVLSRFHHVVVPKGGGCVHAWNCAAGISEAPVMIQLSDDWIPVPKWDKLILDRIGDVKEPRVLAISDGQREDRLLCMAICTRTYYYQDWFLFHPRFTGVFSDNYFTEMAYRRGQVIEAKDIVFKHQHPVFGTAKVDATYAAQNSLERYAFGKAIFDELMQDKDWSTVPGFFNYWSFYEGIATRHLKDGDTIAEIGTWFGRSLIYLLQSCKRQGKNVKAYAVDCFTGEVNQEAHKLAVEGAGGNIRKDFEENLRRCEVADMVEIIEGDSAESAKLVQDKSLAFCFIDAAHDYESVKRDITAWMPKLAPKAVFAGHDIVWHEVEKAVKELVPNYKVSNGVVWVHQLS